MTNLSEPLKLNETERPRFFGWIEVQDSGCHLWMGGKSGDGYGQIRIRGTMLRCHRLAWAIEHGPIPVGMWVLHTCDVPACVNPDHLFLGSHQENQTDMAKKQRGRKSRCGLPYGASLREGGKFQSRVTAGGVAYCLGTYLTAEEASAVAQGFKVRRFRLA